MRHRLTHASLLFTFLAAALLAPTGRAGEIDRLTLARGGGGDEVPEVATGARASIEQLAREQLEKALARGGEIGGAQWRTADDPLADGFRCLPSCAADDARFLAVASGADLLTLSRSHLDVEIGAPAGTSELRIGIFDGDADAANGSWDVGAAPFAYTLYADPTRDGSGQQLVAGPFASDDLINDGWFDFLVAPGPEARSPSGNYFYRLAIENLDPQSTVLNSFKVRTDGVMTIETAQQPFGFYAAIQSFADANRVFPAYPEVSPTTYDGSFDFYLDVATGLSDLVVWNGDLDHGSFDGGTADVDDPDTANAPFLPSWATADAIPEGVAQGIGQSTGSPADDRDPAGLGQYLQRSPSIVYQIIDPRGNVFPDPNPSGNQEWEQFRITTGAFDRSTADEAANELPAGLYVVRAEGVDMQNLNFWRFGHPVRCVEQGGEPCEVLHPFLVGDTVFLDLDGDGVQQAGERGLEGVTLELLNAQGTRLEDTVSASDGSYSFDVAPGVYTVRVAALNFLPGQPLEDLDPTTGDELTATIVGDNELGYDFGYQPRCAPPLGGDHDLDVLVFDDFIHSNTDVYGRLAVGGDATLLNLSVGLELPDSGGTRDTLVVGGHLDFDHGTVYHGNVAYGGSADLSQVTVPGGTVRQDAPIDFAAERSAFEGSATAWSGLPANGATTINYWGGPTAVIELDGADLDLNVFDLPGADLSNANTVIVRAPATSTVLINVDGATVRMHNFGVSLEGVAREQVVFNLHQATDLRIQGVGVQGSLLAPRATMTLRHASVHGNVIAGSIDASGATHHQPFAGCLPVVDGAERAPGIVAGD